MEPNERVLCRERYYGSLGEVPPYQDQWVQRGIGKARDKPKDNKYSVVYHGRTGTRQFLMELMHTSPERRRKNNFPYIPQWSRIFPLGIHRIGEVLPQKSDYYRSAAEPL